MQKINVMLAAAGFGAMASFAMAEPIPMVSSPVMNAAPWAVGSVGGVAAFFSAPAVQTASHGIWDVGNPSDSDGPQGPLFSETPSGFNNPAHNRVAPEVFGLDSSFSVNSLAPSVTIPLGPGSIITPDSTIGPGAAQGSVVIVPLPTSVLAGLVGLGMVGVLTRVTRRS